MAESIDRRCFLMAAAMLPLAGAAPPRAQQRNDRSDEDAGVYAAMIGDLGMEARDPLLLLAAIRAAARAGDAPDRLWVSTAREETISSELAAAIAQSAPVATKSPQTTDPAVILGAREEKEILLPPDTDRLRLKTRLKRPGYEQQKLLSASGRETCELRIFGAQVLRPMHDARPAVSQAPFLMTLPWEAILVRKSNRIRVLVRNMYDAEVTFAYRAFPEGRA